MEHIDLQWFFFLFAPPADEKAFSLNLFKVARYSFSGPKPPKFEHKLRRHIKSFGKLPPQLY